MIGLVYGYKCVYLDISGILLGDTTNTAADVDRDEQMKKGYEAFAMLEVGQVGS